MYLKIRGIQKKVNISKVYPCVNEHEDIHCGLNVPSLLHGFSRNEQARISDDSSVDEKQKQGERRKLGPTFYP